MATSSWVGHYAKVWGMPKNEQGYAMAAGWYNELQYTDWAAAIHVPVIWQGKPCICIACSNNQSTRRCAENTEEYHRTGRVQHPHWMDYAVYVCYDKNVLNFHGIRAAVAGTGGHYLGMGFGEFIDEVLGNPQWRASYLPIGAGYLYKSMRDVIAQKLNVNIWLEVCVGRSKHAYCALDVCMDVWTPSGRSCQDNAHFLLYSHFEKGERELVVPGKWWQYDIYQSYGQQPPWNEWVLEDQG